ncbi:hypothetical protein [Paraburkholderia bryophila]|uniref:Uncharacterized protein n=1 Tax=Paraburkholderia bryophila TaxID=420952 RepID=A0A7Y9WRM3_9BURK|nr:hypothetical protein [Paraburkholderia bryophila]NYH24668.1 hypothetical protein [Paraburkholderia bryophila]
MAKTIKAANSKKSAATTAKKAKKVALPVLDPAHIPVMHHELHSFKTFGRSKCYKRIVELDGVGAAALIASEKDAPALLASGKTLAYVGEDLCVVTTDMALIESAVKDEFEAELTPKAMALYAEHIGLPFFAGEREYENVRGTPYGLYSDCIEQEDFDKVDAEMAASYEVMLLANAEFAKKPMGEPKQLFADPVDGQPLAATILNLVVGAHEHEKISKDWHHVAVTYTKTWKAKHGLSKVDHACPKYRAFTRNVWMQHKYHRDLAALARSYLSRMTEQYVQASGVPL